MAPGPAAELAARIALGRAIRADFARLALEDRPDWYVWAHRLGVLNGLLSALDGLEAAPRGGWRDCGHRWRSGDAGGRAHRRDRIPASPWRR